MGVSNYVLDRRVVVENEVSGEKLEDDVVMWDFIFAFDFFGIRNCMVLSITGL
jgi:predicted RNA-binding protein with PUA domain